MSAARRILAAHGGRPARHGVIAALVVALIAAGTGTGWAYFTAAATATSTPAAATLAITTANFGSVSYTYGNETLTTTGSVTLTNTTSTTSTAVPSLSVVFNRASGSATLAGKVGLQVWATAAAGNCTPAAAVGSGVVSGTWASIPAINGTLAKGASVVYCLRSTIADRADIATTGGTLSFVPRVTGTLRVGNFAGSASATATQSTRYVYPAASVSRYTWWFFKPTGTTQCMDVEGGGASPSGTDVISWPCKSTDTENQVWQFIPAAGGYVEIKPRSAPGLREDTSMSATSGAIVEVITDNNTTSQQWQLQQSSTGVYQLVNRFSGMCLTSPSASGDMTQAPCDGRALQNFTFTAGDPVALDALACTITGNGNNRTLSYSWSVADNGAYVAQASYGGTWYTLATGTTTSSTGMVVATGQQQNGSFPIRFLDAAGTVVGTGSATVTGNSLQSCS